MKKTPQQINFLIPYPLIYFYPAYFNQQEWEVTLTDNIFSNTMSPNIGSGNFTLFISDYLPQFWWFLTLLLIPQV